jgi:hypothetical protein
MRKRGYLELTPEEHRARRVAFLGVALLVMPPLLTLCHLDQVICQAVWRLDVASLIALWPLFPWMLIVAVIMLCGLTLIAIGGALLFVVTTNGREISQSQRIRSLRCVQRS